ncbi:MAG: hypothetical protein HYV95_11685 [Opitutae bacterium]|nr:hypothetical protein [Opitutae bacterium]
MKSQSKFLLLLLGAGLCVAPVLRAQDATTGSDNNPTREERREKRHERMKERGEHAAEELGLSADQKAKMKEFNQQEHSAVEAVRADASLSKEQKKAKAQEIHQSFKGQRDAILTPEQKTKADQMRAKAKGRREKWQERHHEGDDAK